MSKEYKEADDMACRDSVMATYAISPVISQPESVPAWGHFSLQDHLLPGHLPQERGQWSGSESIFSAITAEMCDTASTSTSPDVLWFTQGDISHCVNCVNSQSSALFQRSLASYRAAFIT